MSATDREGGKPSPGSGGRPPRVSTRTGDAGYTGLLGPDRVPKDDPRIEALGDLDEATSAIGVARSQSPRWLAHLLHCMQTDLYVAMAEVAAGSDAAKILNRRIAAGDIARLDTALADLRARSDLKPRFVIPGDSALGASLDVARAVTRRAERRVTHLVHAGLVDSEHVLPHLNRLSDVLFVAARVADAEGAGSREADSDPREQGGAEPSEPSR